MKLWQLRPDLLESVNDRVDFLIAEGEHAERKAEIGLVVEPFGDGTDPLPVVDVRSAERGRPGKAGATGTRSSADT